ncbi:MAG TPA: 6-phosphofructokinase [Dehalococcoidia bacterium]
MNRIGVLTSGGDAPGMNAAIRAVVRMAISHGLAVTGVRDGYAGLIRGDFTDLDLRSVGGIIHRGGTFLGTSRAPEFQEPEGRARAAAALRRAGIDALVVIGGDGSFRGAHLLHQEHGIPVAGVPGTIDNDVGGTDHAIGFMTAVDTALEAIDRIRDTAEAFNRVFFVEVMGRHCGELALEVGLAGGADEILIPELPVNIEALCHTLQVRRERGKQGSIVVVAEGVGGAFEIARQVRECIGYESRVTVVGHVQRGGPPGAFDRVLASRLGAAAVEALLEGQTEALAGESCGQAVVRPLSAAWDHRRTIDERTRHLMRTLGE